MLGMIRGMRRLIAVIALMLGMGALVWPAGAAAQDPWKATFTSGDQCCSSEIEAGETRAFALRARNSGTGQWWRAGAGSPTVRLGTSVPRDRVSVFANSTWYGGNRAADLLETQVGPGFSGQFVFSATAPMMPGTWDEYFEPVAEGQLNGWTGKDASTNCYADEWCGVFFRFQVLPRQAPTLAVSQAPPATVPQGGSLSAGYLGGDNVHIDRFTLSVDGVQVASEALPRPDAPISQGSYVTTPLIKSDSFSPSVPSDVLRDLPPGSHTLNAEVFDLVGQRAQVEQAFEVLRDRDLDGFPDSSDACPREGGRETKEGCPAPHGIAAKSSSLSYLQEKHSATIVKFVVQRPTKGSIVEVDCRDCPKVKFKVKSSRRYNVKKLEGVHLKYGSELQVTVVLDRSSNEYGYEAVHRVAKEPKPKQIFCLLPGSTRRTPCP